MNSRLLPIRPLVSVCLTVLCITATMVAQEDPPAAATLPTVAERSNFTATASYDEVMALVKQIADHSPLVHQTVFGKSHEGRDLPLLIIADPPLQSAQQVRDSQRTIVFAMGNIHAGEVCGKEALLMLARDLAQPVPSPLLKQLVVLIAPIYNADGNERVSRENRPEQNGPEQGVGIRENAQGLDLNRDHVKLESPEAQALAKLLTDYNPHLVVDTHTTNGSRHAFTITYDGPRHPATPAKLVQLARDEFLPAAGKRLESAAGYRSNFYGNFSRGQDRWETYPAWLRYNTQYAGVRGHLAILSEAYSYASYRDRVLATHAFVTAILEEAAARKDALRKAIAEARDELASGGGHDEDQPVAIASRMVPLPEPVRILVPAQTDNADTPHPPQEAFTTLTIPFDGAAEATESTRPPWAYLIPPRWTAVIENLRRHGIQLQVLREGRTLEVERYQLTEWTTDAQPFQGHYLAHARAARETAQVRVAPGTMVARTDQQLGRLLVNLLEPRSEDGLLTWNFFDALREDKNSAPAYPIYRLMREQPLLTAEPPAEPEGPRKRLSFDAVFGSHAANFSGYPRADVTWLPDGRHFVQWRNDRPWKIHARTGHCQPLFDRDAIAKAVADAAQVDTRTARDAVASYRLTWNKDHSLAVTQIDGDYYLCRLSEGTVQRLTATPQEEELLSFSPDGARIAWVRDEDLYAIDLEDGEERRLTQDGSRLVRHGKADWVYFEEIYNRSWRAYRWSPDSRAIAFLEFDDRPVNEFAVLRHLNHRGFVERERYPKAGDPIPHVRLGVVAVQGGPVTWLPLDDYSVDNRILTRYGWLPDSRRLFVMVQDRAQKWLDYCHADPKEGMLKRMFRTRSPYWVDDPLDPVYLADESFLMCSERDGWRHIYHWNADGSLRRQVTQGKWEVRSLDQVDEDERWLYFHATKDSPLATNFYRVRIDGSDLQCLTPPQADHQANVAPKTQSFVDSYSTTTRPTRVVLRRSNGKILRTMDVNPVEDLDQYQLGDMASFEIPMEDGTTIPGTLVYPVDFDPTRKYPVWLMTYGGPHAPTLANRWNDGRKFDHLLAAHGILAFRCDPRSASGRGAVSTWVAYQQLGVQETKDLEDAVDWLCQKPYVDGARIGMSGYSYGGYLTAYVLTHSKKFCAGIAGAPVTDWRNYDAFYTERYMNTPQENPEGYDRSSVIKAASDLHGRLLLIHGSMDDNVHIQNTLQLAHQLQEHDIPFEMMVYPTSRHGIHGNHFQRLNFEFICRTLKADGPSKDKPNGQPVAADSP